MSKKRFVPVTPGGTVCTWLISESKKKAWKALMKDAAHMPYGTKEKFILRGYTVARVK